jgi:hypothetical protein
MNGVRALLFDVFGTVVEADWDLAAADFGDLADWLHRPA